MDCRCPPEVVPGGNCQYPEGVFWGDFQTKIRRLAPKALSVFLVKLNPARWAGRSRPGSQDQLLVHHNAQTFQHRRATLAHYRPR